MWLKLAEKQLELFRPEEWQESKEQQRRREMSLLPSGYEDIGFGPFYHGSPVINRIMETGLGTKKTPTFSGFNEPLFPENLYFGINPGIAKEYAKGSVAGMNYGDIINLMDEYLETADWTKEEIIKADESDFNKFESDLSDRADEWDDDSSSPYDVAQVIWKYLRSPEKDESGVVEFKSPISSIRPDEDFIYQLISHGSSEIDINYTGSMIDYEYIINYCKKIIKYIVLDILESIQKDQLIDNKIKSKINSASQMEDSSEAFDKILHLLRSDYKNVDEYDIADDLGINNISELGRDTLINLDIAQKFIGWLKPDTLRALGVISIFSAGKANVPPIPKEKFLEHKVRKV